MNKIFKVIWNHATQMWIVVSELTKSHGKSTNQTDKRQLLKTILISITASGTLLFALPSFPNSATVGGGVGTNVCTLNDNKDLACGNNSTQAGGNITNSGKGNIAIGVGSVAKSVNNKTAGAGNIAMGHNVSALGSASIAIGISTGNYGGTNTIAAGANSYAIGNGASTGGYGTPSPERNGGWKQYDTTPEAAANAGNPGALGGIAIGSEAWVMGNSTYGIAIGDNATARGVHAMAYGRIAYAKGDYTIAMGTNSNASGNNALALGQGSNTSGQNALSLGAHTKASGIQSIAIGGSSSRDYAATASGASSISLGEETNSSNAQAVAIGKRANSSGAQAIALGFESKAANSQAIAIGKSANASANQSIAIGDDSKASHEQSIALGKSAQAKADKAIAAGHNAKVESSNAVALGNDITIASGYNNAVILGSGSNTQDGKKYSAVTVNDISYSNFAGHNNVDKGDIVSIGNTTHKRQLVNVAPGAITAASTDAVNGSQLYMVADTVANLAKATAAHLGGGSKLSNNNITAPSYQLFTGKSESAQGGNSNTLLTGSPFTNVGAALSGLNEYINKGFTITNNENTTKGVVTPGDTVKFTNGKNTLSNVKQEAGGVTEITFDIVDTDVTVANGKVATPNTDDGKKLVNATTVAKAINESFWKVGKATSINDITFNNTDDEVKAGDEVRFADGKFTTVSVGNKDTNGKTTNVIKVDVDAQKVVEAAQTPVVYTDKDGNKLIKKDNGKFAKADGTEINPQDVIASINSGGNSTTTPTTLANIKSNLTEDQNGNSSPTIPNPPKKNNAATVSDVLNSGWNLQENGTAKDFVKHGDTVNFVNGTGTKVTITKENNGNKIRIDTPLAYVNTATTDTSTPSNTVKLVGGNNNDPVSLSNLASGLGNQDLATAAASNPNNAINVKDLHNAISGYSFMLSGEKNEGEFEALSTNTDDDKQIKKGDTFKLNAGKNIKIKQIADGYEIATKDQIELGKNDPNGTNGSLNVTGVSGAGVKIDGTDGSLTLTGLPNNGQTPSLKITSKKGKKTLDTTDPADGINRITYTDNGKERQVATMDDGLTFAGDFGAEAPRKLGEKLTIKGGETDTNKLSNGHNIGVESNANGTLTVKLAKKLNLGDPNNANNGEVGGLAHNLPQPADTETKQEAPNNIADKNNHAATVGDVLNAGFNVRGAKTADGQVEDVDFVKPYDTVEFVDGNATDLIVTASDDNKKTTVKVDIKTDNTTIKVDDANKRLTAVTSGINTAQGTDGKPTFTAVTDSALVTAKTVSDLVNSLVTEGLDFTGNNKGVTVHRDLGTKLTIKGEKTDDTEVSAKNIYVKANTANNELLINFSEKPEFKELKLAENGKSSITLNTTGDTTNPALTLKGDGNKAVALKNVAAGTTTLDGTHRGDKATGQNPTRIDDTNPMGQALKQVYKGLANLQGSPDTNAFTVADAKNLGWIVSAKNNDYAADVRHANEVRFIGTNMATVTGKTSAEGVREITVDVNAQKVVETAQIPVVYTDKAGNKLIKSPNGKFYAAGTALNAQGEPENSANQEVPAENVIASLNDAKGNTTNPTTLANVKSNLTDGNDKTSTPEFVSLNTSNAATVGDVLNSGWDLLENGTAKDFVKHGDKVNFINGRGTKVTIGVDNGANTIKFDTPLAYVNEGKADDQSTPSNEVKLVGADDNNPVKLGNIASGLGGKSLSEAATATPNNAVNVSDLNKAIDDFNFKLGGKASTDGEFTALDKQDCEDGCIKKDETFVLDAGKNIKIKQIANGYEVATKDQITLGSKTANNQEGVDGNLTVTGKEGASVAIDGKDGSITLTGAQDNNNHTPKVKINTEKGDPTVKDAQNGIDRIVYTTMAPDGSETKRQVATMDDGLVFAGDSGDESPRKLGEKLTIKGGETQTDKLSNNNNIGVVSDGAGNLTIKLAKNLNLSEPNDTNNGKISGLGHNLPEPDNGNKQGANNPNITAENQHNAATVGDVLNAGWNLKNNNVAKDFVKPYDTVNFVDGANAQLVVTTKEDGTASDVTVNVVGLPVQYTTKDGIPVVKVGNKYYKVDENGKPITKKDDGSDAEEIPVADLITNIVKPGTAPNVKSEATTLGNVVSALKPYSETTPTTLNTSKGNLLDLNTKDADGNTPISEHNVVTVGDLRKMGWVVSSNKTTGNLANTYNQAVMNAHEVKFVGTGVATVSGKTEGETHTITVDVNAQDVNNKAHLPVVYTKSDGTKVVKDPLDGKFYEVNDQGEPDKAKEVQPNEIIASINNPSNDKNTAGKPTALTNLKGNLNRVNKEGKVTDPTGSLLDPAVANDLTKAPVLPSAFDENSTDYKPTILNNAATIGDVLNAGWNLQGNGKAVDFVKPFDTVNFADGIGTTVDVKASQDGKTNIIKVNTVMAYTDANGNLLKKANDGKYYLPDQVNDDGTIKDTAVAVDNPQVNLVNAKDNNTTTPTRLGNVAGGTNTYADKAATADGQPLVKVGDKYYAPDQFTGGKLNTNAVETPLENGVEPTSNVTKAKSGLADLEHSDPNNVMTVSDAKNMGWIVSADGNDYAKDVRNANEVKFIGGTGISVTGETKNNTREITIAIKEGEVVPSNEFVNPDNNEKLVKVDGKFYKESDIDPTTGKPREGVKEVPQAIANKAINKGTGFVTGNKVADAIKKSYWTLAKASAEEIAKTTFNNNDGNAENINPNDNVRFSDGKNTRVGLGTVLSLDADGNKVTTTTVKFDVDSPIDFKYTDETGKEYVKANNGKFYAKEDVNADGSLKTVAEGAQEPTALTPEAVKNLKKGAQLINGLGDGKANDAYAAQDPITKAIEELRKTTPNPTEAQISDAKKKAIADNPNAKDTIAKGTGGVNLDNVAWAEKPDQAVNKDQLDQTVNKSGFLVKQNSTSTLTDNANKGSTEDGKTEKVTPNDVVDFVNGTNTSVTATTTRENGRDVTKVRVDVTGMPVTYTDKEGNKVAKAPDGKYYKVDKDTGLPKVEEGADIPADKLVASMVNPDGDSTTKPTTLSNIANGASTFDAPKGEGDKALKLANDGKWYEADKVDPNGKAKDDAVAVTKPKDVGTGGLVDFANSNPNNAVNIGDLQNLGWVVNASQTEGGYTDQVRNTNKVDFVGEGLAKVTGVTRNDGTREIKVSVQTGEVIGTNSDNPVLKNDDGTKTPVIKIGNQYFKKEDLNPETGLPKATAQPLTAEEVAKVVNEGNKGAGLVTGNQVGDAIQNSGWNVGKATAEEVNKTTFNNNDGKAEKVNPNDNVRFSDGKNTVARLGTVKVVDEHGVITTTTTVKVDVDSPIDFKYTDASGKEYVKANDGKFYEKVAVNNDGSLKDPVNPPTALDQDAIAKLTKGAQLTNGSQADGVNNEAYNVVDPIQAAIQQAISEKLKANPNAPAEEIAKAIDTARAEAVKMHPNAKDNITQGTGGVTLNNVGWATQPDQAVNKDQLDQTVSKAGFLVKQNGGSTIAGQETEKVTPNDVVNFINGGNTVAKAETTRDPATGQDRTDVSIHMTGLPLTYTAKDGTPVTKVGDQYFKVNANGYPIGEAVPASELTTNLVNPTAKANEIGAPTVLGNVASGTNTIANKVSADGKPLIQVGQGANAKYYTPDQFENGVLKANATEAVNPVEATQPMDKARGGLADLAHSHPNNALSVSDASKLGFVVGAKDNQYAADVRNANAVEFVSGNDIAKVTGETRADGVREIKVTVSKNPIFESVQVGGAQGPRIGSSKDGNIRIAKADGSPSRLTNVAPGIEATDAVNVGQLNAKIGDVHKRINKLDKGMRAGVAGATAVAFLQRPNEAGKSLVSLGVGNFKGQSAVAVGYSRNSDNNKISIKLGSGFNTNGDVNIGGSIGYQW